MTGKIKRNWVDFHIADYPLRNITIPGNNTYTNTNFYVNSVIPDNFNILMGWVRATGGNEIYCYQCIIYPSGLGTVQLRNINSNAVTVTPWISILSVRQI